MTNETLHYVLVADAGSCAVDDDDDFEQFAERFGIERWDETFARALHFWVPASKAEALIDELVRRGGENVSDCGGDDD